jgi:hypothetical protein
VCLNKALWVFSPACTDVQRTLRVLRGLHGFQLYAHERWIDHLLTTASHCPTLQHDGSTVLVQTLQQFGQNVTVDSFREAESTPSNNSSTASDRRLEALNVVPSIYGLAKVELENKVAPNTRPDSDYGTSLSLNTFAELTRV